MLVAREQDVALGVGDRDDAAVEPTLGERRPSARRWLSTANASTSARSKPSSVAMRSAEMPCGTVGNAARKSGLPAVDGDGSGGEVPARHRLDAARDHQVLVPARHAHGRDRDRLLRGSAEAVQRQAGHGLGPSGEQRRQPTDGVVVTGEDAVAGDHVVDLLRVEPASRAPARGGTGRTAPGDGRRAARRRHALFHAACAPHRGSRRRPSSTHLVEPRARAGRRRRACGRAGRPPRATRPARSTGRGASPRPPRARGRRPR